MGFPLDSQAGNRDPGDQPQGPEVGARLSLWVSLPRRPELPGVAPTLEGSKPQPQWWPRPGAPASRPPPFTAAFPKACSPDLQHPQFAAEEGALQSLGLRNTPYSTAPERASHRSWWLVSDTAGGEAFVHRTWSWRSICEPLGTAWRSPGLTWKFVSRDHPWALAEPHFTGSAPRFTGELSMAIPP